MKRLTTDDAWSLVMIGMTFVLTFLLLVGYGQIYGG